VVCRPTGKILEVDPAIIERGHINPDDVVEGVLPDQPLARQGRSKGTAVPACAPLTLQHELAKSLAIVPPTG
jgi:hypothetical protein